MTTYDEEVLADIRQYLERAESEVYDALTAAQDEVVGSVVLENALNDIHNDILSAIKQL